MDFQRFDGEDDADPHALFFEGPDGDAPAPATVPTLPDLGLDEFEVPKAAVAETTAPEPANPSRKRVRGKPAPIPAVDSVAEIAASLPVLQPEPAAAAPAEPAPAAVPRGSGRLPVLAAGLASLAALMSSVGLIVTARQLADLRVERAEAAHIAEALAEAPAALAELQRLTAARKAELARSTTAHPTAPLTVADLRRELDVLRLGLSRSQSPGTAALAGVVRSGQSELAERIEELRARIAAMEGRRHRP